MRSISIKRKLQYDPDPGVILAYVWGESKMPVVDRLGPEFLDYVKDGMTISVEPDGVVVVE